MFELLQKVEIFKSIPADLIKQLAILISPVLLDSTQKVVDILGKEILQEIFSVNSGGGTKELNLNPGIYVLVLTNDKRERIINKIIVQ